MSQAVKLSHGINEDLSASGGFIVGLEENNGKGLIMKISEAWR